MSQRVCEQTSVRHEVPTHGVVHGLVHVRILWGGLLDLNCISPQGGDEDASERSCGADVCGENRFYEVAAATKLYLLSVRKFFCVSILKNPRKFTFAKSAN